MKRVFKILLVLFHIVLFTNLDAKQNDQKYVIGPWPGGMGVSLHSTLNHLLHCENTGKIPVVYWGKGSTYYTPKGFNGQKNGWEYYFKQVSNFNYKKGDKIINYCTFSTCGRFKYYELDDEKRMLANSLVEKYIKLNSTLQRKVDQFYEKHLMNKTTIGLHIRGTDKFKEEKPVSPRRMVEEALKYANENTQFFIATDEVKILNELISLLPKNRTIYYKCARSENGQPLHQVTTKWSKDKVAQNGEDVVVEMFLLSKCDMLFRTLSSVSAVPLYLNPLMNFVTLK